MALKFPDRYPGRWDPTSVAYPQGKFKNRTSPTAKDGSYLEADWANDWAGFFGALLNGAGIAPNGVVDTASASQLYDALRIGGYKQANVITATSTVLTAAQVGQAFLFSTASSTCQLPAASSVPTGGVFKIETSAGLTLSVTGGAVFQAGSSLLTNLVLPAGTEVSAMSVGSTWWVAGVGTIPNSMLYSGSKSVPGWKRTPDGYIEQWGVTGVINDGDPGVVVTLPVSFPSKNLGGFGNVLTIAGTGQSTEIQVLATSNSSITVGYNATIAVSSAVSWRVWGY